MAKSTGHAQTTLSVDDSSGTAQDIRNDITNWQLATPRGVQDVTGVDKSANERLLLLADASITLNGVFNPAAGKSHAVFKTEPSPSVNRTESLTSNGLTHANEIVITAYQLSRSDSGELTWSAPGSLADGTVPVWS